MSGKTPGRLLLANPGDVMAALERDAQNSRRHFVDEHWVVLEREVSRVDGIMKELLEEDLLSPQQYKNVCRKGSPQAQMRQLYLYSVFWDEEDKDDFLDILKKHHGPLIAGLQSGKYKPEGESELSGESSGTEVTQLEGASCSSSLSDDVDCELCGQIAAPADVLVVPTVQEDTYRLDLKSAGCFLCSQTGIKFRVTRAVTIEYQLDSWCRYMEFLPCGGSEVLGPLFSIRTPLQPNIVSAVYLPHYLCWKELGGGDTSWIKCAHFKDGNLSVETPSQVLPFYLLLENPSFSSIGAFFWRMLPNSVSQHIPLHGKVLLYFRVVGRKHLEYKIHLYLLPGFAPVSKEFHQEKLSGGFRKIDKPQRTRTVYTARNYSVTGPEEAYIDPLLLEVLCISPLESFTDITIEAEKKMFALTVVAEGSTERIWGCQMSRGEIEEFLPETSSLGLVTSISPHLAPRICGATFVDKHRKDLIQGVVLVPPILDALKDKGLVTDEDYDLIKSQGTSQEKMRMLFSYTKSWGPQHKEMLYEALEQHNGPLIQALLER